MHFLGWFKVVKETSDKTGKIQNKPQLFKPGQSGNPKGRPKGSQSYITQLEKAIKTVEKEKNKSLWKRLVERAFVNDKVLIALVKKFIPDKTHTEIEGLEIPVFINFEGLTTEELKAIAFPAKNKKRNSGDKKASKDQAGKT